MVSFRVGKKGVRPGRKEGENFKNVLKTLSLFLLLARILKQTNSPVSCWNSGIITRHCQLGSVLAPEDHRPPRVGASRGRVARRGRGGVGGEADVIKFGGDVVDAADAAEDLQSFLLLSAGREGVGGVREEEAAEGEDDGRDCC